MFCQNRRLDIPGRFCIIESMRYRVAALCIFIVVFADGVSHAQSTREYEYRQELESSYVPAAEKNGYSLYLSAARGEVQEVARYLRQGVDVNYQPVKGGKTPLMAAAVNGHVEVIRLLVQEGAALEMTDRDHGRTALMWARHNDRTDAAALLKSLGAEDRPEPRFSRIKIRRNLLMPSFILFAVSTIILSVVMVPKVRWNGIRLGIFNRNSLKYASYYHALCRKEGKSSFWYYLFLVTFYLGAAGFAVVLLVSVDIRFAGAVVVIAFILHKMLNSN